MGGDALGERVVRVEVAHAAEIAFAFFAYVTEKQERRGELRGGVCKGSGQGKQSGKAGAVISGSGDFEAVLIVDATEHGVELGFGREDGIEMRGENYDGAGACGVEVRGGKKGQHVADFVGFDGVQADFCEALGQPSGARLLAERRCGNFAELGLPIEDGFRIGVEPCEGGVHGAHSGQCSDAREGRSGGRGRHDPRLEG